MAYTPTVWNTGDVITAEKMNKLEQGVQNEQVGPQGPAGPAGKDGAAGATGPAGAAASALGGVKMAAAVNDAAAAPTMEEFNALLTALRNAGILATS